MRLAPFIASILLLSPFVLATPLEYFETNIEIDSKVSNFTMMFFFQEAPNETFEYPLPFSIENFKATANFKNYTCVSVPKPWGSLIRCDFSNVSEGGRVLNLKFTSKENVKEIEKNLFFSADVKTPQDVKKMVVKVILSEGYVLINEPKVPTVLVPFSPRDGKEGSDGRKIFVEWEREGVKKGEGISVAVTYESIKPISQFHENYVLLAIGVFLVVAVILIGSRTKKIEVVAPNILKEDERKVIEIIKERGGMCKQRVIVRETDFSKAKVSRIIKELEERGIVTTEKAGRSKKVYLKRSD